MSKVRHLFFPLLIVAALAYGIGVLKDAAERDPARSLATHLAGQTWDVTGDAGAPPEGTAGVLAFGEVPGGVGEPQPVRILDGEGTEKPSLWAYAYPTGGGAHLYLVPAPAVGEGEKRLSEAEARARGVEYEVFRVEPGAITLGLVEAGGGTGETVTFVRRVSLSVAAAHGVVILLLLGLILTIVPLMIWGERKVAADIQDRIGPNRCTDPLFGKLRLWGLFQPLADAIKLLTKEDIVPLRADRVLYILGPFLAFFPAALAFGVIPVGARLRLFGAVVDLQILDPSVGVLLAFAIGSIGVYGIALGGWASNNKWSMLGALRGTAQMISYEVALALSLIAVLMVSGTLRMSDIVAHQSGTMAGGWLPAWNIFTQPIAFLIFLIAAFAETNRLPFDMPESEAELVAGYHTEYSSMKFAMFFMGEYVAMITMSSLVVTLFLGGWHLPGFTDNLAPGLAGALLSFLVFGVKIGAILYLYIWVRWTLPRFRYDQLMARGWKSLIPLGLLNLFLTAFLMLNP